MQWEKLSETIQIAIDDAHRFGTDAFLLEHFAAVRGIDTVCDLCAGCGIIGLLMLRRERPPQSVTAVEIAPDAVELMRQTAEASSLMHFAPLRGDLREIRTLLPAHSFRLVTCNPPYFPAGSGYLCPEDSRRRARHEQEESCTIGNEGNVSVTDRNGDGLLWAALQSGNAETVELVVKAGATGENHNLYWAEPAALTIAERQDWQQLLSTLEEQHTDTGCTAPSIAYYCTAMGNAERLSLYLAHFPLSAEEAALPEGDSTTVALRYGVESAQTGNLLDLAVANDDTETAAVLLQNGVTASPLLLKKLQASPTTLSDEMLALLGSYRYFVVLDEVLADYRAFKESYEAVAGESCRRFERDYAAYCEAMEKGDSFAAAGIMDSGLLDEIVGQLQAVQNVAKPETEAINALWDLMYEYADMMDTAGYYYKRISLSTYVVTRRYYRALFENRLGRAHALYEEFKHQTAVYDGLLQNWAE